MLDERKENKTLCPLPRRRAVLLNHCEHDMRCTLRGLAQCVLIDSLFLFFFFLLFFFSQFFLYEMKPYTHVHFEPCILYPPSAEHTKDVSCDVDLIGALFSLYFFFLLLFFFCLLTSCVDYHVLKVCAIEKTADFDLVRDDTPPPHKLFFFFFCINKERSKRNG